MPFIRDPYLKNPKKYLSPPISPKQSLDYSLHYNSSSSMNDPTARKDIQNNWIPLESLPLSPPSTSYAVRTPEETLEQQQRHARPVLKSSPVIIASNRRKQKKPNPSLPSSTLGAFQMPFVSHNCLKSNYPTSISLIPSQGPPSTLSSFSNQTSAAIATEIKRRNDCGTARRKICLASMNKKQSKRSIDYRMSIHAILSDDLPNKRIKTNGEYQSTTQSFNEYIKHSYASVTSSSEEDAIHKKAKTDAALMYDNLSADSDEATLFRDAEEWIPNLKVFDGRPNVRISWKGSPLRIKHMPFFEKLHPGEASIAASLRLMPGQYLKCKWALVLAAKHAYETKSMFRKSEAQKVCCIDVNKTSVLWNTFGKLGWLGPKWPH